MTIPIQDIASSFLDSISRIAVSVGDAILGDRSFGGEPPLLSPPPQSIPYSPPFSGGQCSTLYWIRVQGRVFFPNGAFADTISNTLGVPPNFNLLTKQGAITDISPWNNPTLSGQTVGFKYTANGIQGFYGIADYGVGTSIILDDIRVVRTDGLNDDCGDTPSPNPSIPPSVGGGGLLPYSDVPLEVFGGGLLPAYDGLIQGLGDAADLVQSASDIPNLANAVGDALDKLKDILDAFLKREKEKDKEDKQKRKISVGAWRSLSVDGGFAVDKFTAQDIEYSPYQLQVEIERFPSAVSRRLGVFSPSFCHLEPMGWIFLRSANGGYSEPIALRFLRNSISLNQDTFGVSYSFREFPLIVAKARLWYSSPP